MKSTEEAGSVSERLAGFADPVSGLQYEQIPGEITSVNRAQTYSMIGAVLASRKSPYFPELKKFFRASKEKPRQVCALATCSMLYDFDDFMFAGHTGHSSVLIPLVYSEQMSGRDFLTAQTVANEFGGRIGASIFFGPHNGQMWTPIHQFMAGAVLGRLWAGAIRDADSRREFIREKILLSLAYPVYPMFDTFFGSSAKAFTASLPILTSLELLELEQNRIHAADFLHPESSFYRAFSFLPLWQAFSDLPASAADAEKFYSRTISIKKYPGCAYISGPVEACRLARDEWLTSGAEIEKIEISCNLLSKKMNDLSAPFLNGADSTLTTLNFSLPVNCALMLLDGRLTPESFARESLGRGQVWDLAAKISIRHDPAETFRMLHKSSMIPDSTSFMLKNLRRLRPYLSHYGALKDMLASPRHLPFHLSTRGARKDFPEEPGRYHLFNGAIARIRLKKGPSLVRQVILPPGFAGTPEKEMLDLGREKLEAQCRSGEFRRFSVLIDNLPDLRKGEIRKFRLQLWKSLFG